MTTDSSMHGHNSCLALNVHTLEDAGGFSICQFVLSINAMSNYLVTLEVICN